MKTPLDIYPFVVNERSFAMHGKAMYQYTALEDAQKQCDWLNDNYPPVMPRVIVTIREELPGGGLAWKQVYGP